MGKQMNITKFVTSQDDIKLIQTELNNLGFIFYLFLFVIMVMAIIQIVLYIKYKKSESIIPFFLISSIPICIGSIVGLIGIKTNAMIIVIEGSLQILITSIITFCRIMLGFCCLLIESMKRTML